MSDVTIKSEVTGSVWRVLVSEGASVDEDQTLIVVESMKMEIPITASDSGEVVSILVKEGDPIAEGVPVVTIRVD